MKNKPLSQYDTVNYTGRVIEVAIDPAKNLCLSIRRGASGHVNEVEEDGNYTVTFGIAPGIGVVVHDLKADELMSAETFQYIHGR